MSEQGSGYEIQIVQSLRIPVPSADYEKEATATKYIDNLEFSGMIYAMKDKPDSQIRRMYIYEGSNGIRRTGRIPGMIL
jgi:hypothetical protein